MNTKPKVEHVNIPRVVMDVCDGLKLMDPNHKFSFAFKLFIKNNFLFWDNSLNRFINRFEQNLAADPEFYDLVDQIEYIRYFPNKYSCKSTALDTLVLLHTKEKIKSDFLISLMISTPSLFQCENRRERFVDIFNESAIDFEFCVIEESEIFYKYLTIFQFVLPDYYNIGDVGKLVNDTILVYGDVILAFHHKEVNRYGLSKGGDTTHMFYVILNANNGCLPPGECIVYDGHAPLPSKEFKTFNFSQYPRFCIHYEPKPKTALLK